jgi:hypothetical protein
MALPEFNLLEHLDQLAQDHDCGTQDAMSTPQKMWRRVFDAALPPGMSSALRRFEQMGQRRLQQLRP